MVRSRLAAILAALIVILSLPCIACGDGIETVGDVITALLPAAAAGMITFHNDLTGAMQFAGAGAVTLGVTYGLKYSINETRPDGGSHSFPSAHSSLSFCSAEFIRKRYGWEYGLPAYALASFVAFSRVEADQHYPKDVVTGAAIGIISSYLFTRPYHEVHVQPEAGGGYYGIRLSSTW